jgi:UMF1 family MFS transporter
VVWSYVTSTAAFLVALGAPILGAIADAGGRRKPWLLATVLLGAPCMAAIWFAVPDMHSGMIWVMAALVGASISFEYSAIFCNAMLPNVAPPGRISFLSGLGLSLGNLMGVLLFLFFLFAWSWNPHPLFGLRAELHEPERAVGMLAAFWFVVFSIPLFLFTPDSVATSRKPGEAIVHGLRQLGGTIAKVGRYKNLVTFLIARMSFNEGFIGLMLFTGVFAKGILHWTPTMLIAEGLINSVVATIAGLFAGWLDKRIGSKLATMIFVAGGMIATVVLVSVTPEVVFFVIKAPPAAPGSTGLFPTLPDQIFLVAQASAAFFVTGGLVTARAMMARLSPREMLNEFFGLFALSGTATAFIGPLTVGVVTQIYNNQRAGVLVGAAFMLAGLLLMILVKEAPAET